MITDKLPDHLPLSLNLTRIAGLTEGFSPSDLKSLVDKTIQQATSRLMSSPEITNQPIRIQDEDFTAALEGTVASSLANVKIETSDVSWSDIGGLNKTKRILLETLEWPTKYAAIFQNSPLRLRSG